MLPCGHTYCDPCIQDIFKLDAKGRGVLKCPSCQVDHSFLNRIELSKLIKNFTLISLIDNRKS